MAEFGANCNDQAPQRSLEHCTTFSFCESKVHALNYTEHLVPLLDKPFVRIHAHIKYKEL